MRIAKDKKSGGGLICNKKRFFSSFSLQRYPTVSGGRSKLWRTPGLRSNTDCVSEYKLAVHQ